MYDRIFVNTSYLHPLKQTKVGPGWIWISQLYTHSKRWNICGDIFEMWIALKTAEQVICMLNKKGDTVHVQQGWIKKVTALDASPLVVSGSGKKSHKYLAQGKVQFV